MADRSTSPTLAFPLSATPHSGERDWGLAGRARLVPATLVIAIGVVVLTGWLLDLGAFKSIVSSFPSMKPNAAIACILAGISLFALQPEGAAGARLVLGRLSAVGVLVIGAVTLGEYLTGWDAGIDQLLFHEVSNALGTSSPGRMGANATVVLVLDGIALLLLDVEVRGIRPAQVLAVTSGAIALVALSGFIFGAYDLTGFGSATRISLYAATAYLALSVGVLIARPRAGVMALASSPGAGGMMFRRLVVPAIAVPLGIGWLFYRARIAGLLEAGQRTPLTLVTVGMFFLLVIWLTARSLDRADTERRQAEEEVSALTLQLAERVRQLEFANAELDSFSYSVSHDLRAPLRAIDGFSRLLIDEHAETLDDGGQRWLALVVKNAHEMGELIDGLLAFSRLGQQSITKSQVPLDDLVREVVAELEARLETDRRVEISIEPLPTVSGDPALLRQVFVNLISNAVKYTREEDVARISIGAHGDAGATVIYVRDNGVGFDMRHADKLFQVFQRLHRAEDYEGTGLGLALVARIISRHGGRIWCESAPGEGATFSFTLSGATP